MLTARCERGVRRPNLRVATGRSRLPIGTRARCRTRSSWEAPTPEALGPILGDMGVLLLFTAAIFAIALGVIGRVRVQSAEAGGNAAASRS